MSIENNLRNEILGLLDFIYEQSQDPGLWAIVDTASEAYLQQCLREVHAEIERRFLAEFSSHKLYACEGEF